MNIHSLYFKLIEAFFLSSATDAVYKNGRQVKLDYLLFLARRDSTFCLTTTPSLDSKFKVA